MGVHTAAATMAPARHLSINTSNPMAISPEHDPHPTWTFFPPSATYIATTTHSISPASSPTLSSNTSLSSRRTSLPESSTPSTHHRILDHCFHLSIETRLKQAEAQYLASTQEQAVEQQIKDQPISALKQDDWRRRQRTLVDEAVVLGRKGSNVEAIVDGILKSHRSSGPLQTLPRHLKHRLHLCQLTSMVFGRFDIASSTNKSAGLNIYSTFHSRRHGASRAAIQQHLSSEQGGKLGTFFSQHPVPSSSYCRRHHRKDCQRTCCTLTKMQQQQQQALEQKKRMANHNQYYMNPSVRSADQQQQQQQQQHQRVAGLVDAIPAFLKCSGMSYTDIAKSMVERGETKELKDTTVLEGWYWLLLEMMTQAVIESYLCDGNAGIETILEVFSYGNDSDISSSASASAEENKDRPTTPTPPSNRKGSMTGTEDVSSQQQTESQDGSAQDHEDDILFAKTPEYEAFMAAKEKRLQESNTH
ncbi:hypothetical protein B0O80DRAFT_32515 [Mortierella sp. GBAus27b]|nr:hypothetical protein B0O80DRAFT_32515 [Mortierella sp. GBAus27b]